MLRYQATRPLPDRLTARHAAAGLVSDAVLNELPRRNAETFAGLPALVDVTREGHEPVRRSHAELAAEVSRVAGFLRAGGIGRGDVVLVQSPNLGEVVVAVWAAWHVGAVVVPVVDIYRSHEMRHILGLVEPAAVVAAAEHRGERIAVMLDGVLGDLGLHPRVRLVLDGEEPGWTPFADPAAGPDPGPQPVSPDDPVLVLFTSGTTSAPKGVVHSSRTLIAEALQSQRIWGVGVQDRSYIALPIAHVSGLIHSVLVPGLTGCSLVLSRLTSTARAASELLEHGVTFCAGAPVLLAEVTRRCLEAGVRPSIRVWVSGGQTVGRAGLAVGEQVGIRAARVYGMTELPSVTASTPADDDHVRLDTDGRLAEGVEAQAVDPETRRALPPGVEGELRVRGPERMLGYLVAAETDAQVDAEGWFTTGDLGVVGPDRTVTVTGRIKDTINRAGEKFSTRDIEDVLGEHPAVAGVAVVAARDARYGEVPAAFLVADPAVPRPGEQELARHLAERGVARQKTPVHWRWCAELPVTATGKVRKAELKNRIDGEDRPVPV
ncbi:class I adenylate-forming enzyme family protein [Pseudonocardia sp. NPDC049154]|uniref:class I adenylate-forming enzyme family protein n=1 Tax=Pseudonocardia sp. NPDC049154 TaxID=3155501 RepID=UPI0033DA8EDB